MAGRIVGLEIVGIYVFHLTNEPHETPVFLLEKENTLAVKEMIPERQVAPGECHVPCLTFPRISEHIIVVPAILVTVLMACLTREYENVGVGCRRTNAALPIAAIDGMDIRSPVVNMVGYERDLVHFGLCHWEQINKCATG